MFSQVNDGGDKPCSLFFLQLITTANLAFNYWHSLIPVVPMSRAKKDTTTRRNKEKREKEKRCDAPP